MDLGIYIGELLGLQGEVSVPGIGHFAQVRINGYFNEQENKFYPPAHEVSFDLQTKDEEELARYISGKKNISIASSKYFIDKYIISIQQLVGSQKVEIAGIGYLYTDNGKLAFNPENKTGANDPSFYGFSPVSVTEPPENTVVINDVPPPVKEEVPVREEAPIKEELPVIKEEEPVEEEIKAEGVPQEIIPATVIPPDPAYVDEPQEEEVPEYSYEEPEEPDHRNMWVALLLIAIIALLALLGLYKYKPGWFDRKENPQLTFVGASTDSAKNANGDTTKKADSTAAATTLTNNAPVDTLATLHYDILGGAFKTLPQANALMKNYQKLGLQPRILNHIKGNSYIITLGTYFNQEQAQKAIDSIANNTKLRKGPDIFLQTYNPKKK